MCEVGQKNRTWSSYSFPSSSSVRTSPQELLEKIGNALLEKEVLSRDDMIALAGPRPFQQKTTYEEFLDDSTSKAKGECLA